MLKEFRDNKFLYIISIGLVSIIGVMSIFILNKGSEIKAMRVDHTVIMGEVNELVRFIEAKEEERRVMVNKATEEVTGLNRDLLVMDTDQAETYFRPAFEWETSKEYDMVRKHFITELNGEGSFVNEFLSENEKLKVNGEDISLLDTTGMKSHYEDIYIVPMTGSGHTISYVGFVRYYMHKFDSNSVDTSRLDGSDAIIKFTVTGDPAKNERKIKDVDAWSGFVAEDGTGN